jgi:hypothetical protein
MCRRVLVRQGLVWWVLGLVAAVYVWAAVCVCGDGWRAGGVMGCMFQGFGWASLAACEQRPELLPESSNDNSWHCCSVCKRLFSFFLLK